MKRNSILFFAALIIILFSLRLFAEDTIRITVKTNEESAFGIGYSVDGKNSGTVGKVYTGKGIKNKKYIFGYRKKTFYGANILCGSMMLTKDSTVYLSTEGDKCHTVIIE